MHKVLAFGLAAVATAAFGLSGCSSDSYDNPDVQLYAADATATTLVEAATVRSWVDAGGTTETGQRVVIFDCVPNPDGIFAYSDTDSWFAGDKTKVLANIKMQYGELSPQYKSFSGMPDTMFGHIPGAIPSVAHEGYEVTKRNDGPILADHEVGTGDLISQMLQKSGVTKNDVIVLTTSRYDYPGFCSARLWWTLRYWGFPRNQILVLNGGNKAYAMAGNPLQKGVTLPIITPSTFNVVDLSQKFFGERISLGEVIALVDSGRTTLANDEPNKVVVIDTRQPPVAYYFKDAGVDGIPDIFQTTDPTYDPATKLFTPAATPKLTLSERLFTATVPNGGLAIPFSAIASPPINLTVAPASTYLAIPLGAKEAAFEGIMRGAKITKTSTYNITVPALTRADGGYKTKAELKLIFADAGIDGSKPIITYCNSGALASIYYYALKEICGFPDVRIYDGSWQEWANLAAYEPATLDYVMNDDYATFPSYPSPSPSVVFFAGQNHYFTFNPTDSKFYDSQTGVELTAAQIKPGGLLGGIPTWDTVSRSEFVMFRPMATQQGAALNLNGTANYRNKTYTNGVDWPSIPTYPNYQGEANEIRKVDEAYKGGSTSSGGGAPTPFVPKGGGC
jgi:3-mercaptopyruvate sulfurtransferase SseA